MNEKSDEAGLILMWVCPVCEDWTLEDQQHTPPDQIEAILLEHTWACFGLPEDLDAVNG